MQLLSIAKLLAEADIKCEVFTLELREKSPRIQQVLAECFAIGVKVFEPPGHSFSVVFRLTRIILYLIQQQNAIVWTWGVRSDIVSKIAAMFNRRTTNIVSLRSAGEDVIRSKSPFLRFGCGRVSAYVSNSELNIELFKRVTGITNGMFHVLRNVVLTCDDQFQSAHPARDSSEVSGLLRVAVLGNNRFYLKGYDTLLEIARISQETGGGMQFCIAGRDYDQTLPNKIREYGVSESVNYVGEARDPYAFLAQNDVYLLTSRVEGMPNALFEAISIGLPVVTTDVGDLRSLFLDKNLIRICDVGDATGLWRQLRDIQTSWVAAIETAENAKRHVLSEFGVDKFRASVLEILGTTLK